MAVDRWETYECCSISSLDPGIDETVPRVLFTEQYMIDSRFPAHTNGRKRDPSSHSHGKMVGPTPQVREGRGGHDVNPSAGCCGKHWLYKHASSPEFNTQRFPTQPSLLYKPLPSTPFTYTPPYTHLPRPTTYILFTTPSTWSKQVRGYQQPLPPRDSSLTIRSQ